MDFSKIDEGHPDYKEGEEPLHFYYNREERIKNAPQIVQDYYSGKLTPKKGLFRVLVANRANRLLLITIFILVIFSYGINFSSNKQKAKLFGTQAKLSSFSYEEQVYASLEFKALKNDEVLEKPYTFHVIFTGFDSSGGEAFRDEQDCQFEGKEVFVRTKFSDYDIIKVSAEITAGETVKNLEAPVEHH